MKVLFYMRRSCSILQNVTSKNGKVESGKGTLGKQNLEIIRVLFSYVMKCLL